MYGFWLLELGLKKGMEWRICGNIWRDGKHRDLRYFQSLFGPCTFCVCRCIGRVAAHTGWGKGHQGRMCYYWHYWDLLDCWHMVIKRANWLWSVLVLILKLSIHTGPLIACARVRIASTAPSPQHLLLFPHPVLPWSLTQWSLKIPSGLKSFMAWPNGCKYLGRK